MCKRLQRLALQLDTAMMFEIFCSPSGSSPPYAGCAGCADIVTPTFLTHGSAATTSFAFCSNCTAQTSRVYLKWLLGTQKSELII